MHLISVSFFQYNFAVVSNGRPNYISEGATVNIYDFRLPSNTSEYQTAITGISSIDIEIIVIVIEMVEFIIELIWLISHATHLMV